MSKHGTGPNAVQVVSDDTLVRSHLLVQYICSALTLQILLRRGHVTTAAFLFQEE